MAQGTEKSVLQRFFRVLGLAEDPEGYTIELGRVQRKNMSKRLPVAVQCPFKPLIWLSNCLALSLELHGVLL
jgi:hypothetical protein